MNQFINLKDVKTLVLVASCLFFFHKINAPSKVVIEQDTRFNDHLLKENRNLLHENDILKLEIHELKDKIQQDSAFVWNISRDERDSLRAIYNPK